MPMLAVLLLLAADPVFPGAAWERASPAAVGLAEAQVRRALNVWAANTGPDGVSKTAIVKAGRLVHASEASREPNGLYSSTKSVTSSVLGLLVDDGTVTLDQPAASIEPLLGPLYPGVTLRHFTTMTSGYSAEGISRWEGENTDWSWTPYAPADPLFAPGTAYAYWDEAQMMLGRTLTRAAGRDVLELAAERLFGPIGITSHAWLPEGSVVIGGRTVPIRNGCTWLSLHAEDLARFGWLMRHRGHWNGRQLLSAEWVSQATQPQVSVDTPIGDTDRSSVDGRGCYGFNWWCNGVTASGDRLMPDLPADAFFSAGLKHNVCLVIPSWDLVLVRLGEDHNPERGHAATLNDVARELDPAKSR